MTEAGHGLQGQDRIELRGLVVVAAHGLLEEERERAQPFELDLDLYLDLAVAGRGDDLGESIDYAQVADMAAAVLGGPHADLLESLAERVASAVLASCLRLGAVRVSLRKLRPPVAHQMTSAGVTIWRFRQSQ